MRKWLTKSGNSIKNNLAVLMFAVVAIAIAACSGILCEIKEQPTSMVAGDSAHFKVYCQWFGTNYDHNNRFVFGMCVPKAWHAGENTTMTLLCSPGAGVPEGMSLMPASNVNPATGTPWSESFRQKFGIGPNYIDELEWVVFQSDLSYTVVGGSNPFGTVSVAIKTSTDNLQFKPGFAFCEDADGTSDFFTFFYGNTWGDCMASVSDGDLQDFCNRAIGFGEPSTSTKNDILTFKYDANLDTLPLKDENEVYLCATAYTNDGQVIERCSRDEASKLVLWDTKKWRIDMWPAPYFGLHTDQELDRIEYFFTDKTGTIRTGFADSDAPFKYTYKCN